MTVSACKRSLLKIGLFINYITVIRTSVLSSVVLSFHFIPTWLKSFIIIIKCFLLTINLTLLDSKALFAYGQKLVKTVTLFKCRIIKNILAIYVCMFKYVSDLLLNETPDKPKTSINIYTVVHI